MGGYMRRIALLAVVCFFAFSGVAGAGTFSLISMTCSVDGGLIDPIQTADYTGTTHGSISDAWGSALSDASIGLLSVETWVSSDLYFDNVKNGNVENAYAYADAKEIILFRPNFKGLGPEIYLEAGLPWADGSAEAYIEDITAGITLAYASPEGMFLSYDAWDSSHIYRLTLVASMVSFTEPEWGWGGGENFAYADIPFSNLPEPSCLLLLFIGLPCLAWLRRR